MDTTLQEIEFKNWLQENHHQISRPEKYIGAIRTISNDLNSQANIKSLFEINEISNLKQLYTLYFSVDKFEIKNSRGNRMYSHAFDLYLEFISENQKNSFNDIVDIIKSNKEGGEKAALILARLGQWIYLSKLTPQN